MANTMRTFVRIERINEKVTEYFNTFITENPESKYFSKKLDVWKMINDLFGTDFSEENPFDIGWGNDNLGSKWLFVEFDRMDMDDEEILFIIETAWSVPVEFLRTLTKKLTEIHEDIIVCGTYEDEGYDPIGAFVFGKDNYSELEDLDEFIDFEQMWDDEEYREQTLEKLNDLRDDLVAWYDEGDDD